MLSAENNKVPWVESKIQDGVEVIFYDNIDSMTLVTIKSGEKTENRNGTFLHDEIIGKEFGERIFSTNDKGWLVVLRPFPDLLGRGRRIRTQIIQPLDANTIIFGMDLKVGSRVVEAGTGSGIMSLNILRTIAPSGHLFSFEFNEGRALQAREELEGGVYGSCVSVGHRNVCEGGFGEELGEGSVDAVWVFLDLPTPWEALHHANRVLRGGGRLCLYSPCMEQVMKSGERLRELDFYDIGMKEAREREFIMTREKIPEPPFEQEEEEVEYERDFKRRRRNEQEGGDWGKEIHPNHAMRGHTAFLTFATRSPRIQPSSRNETTIEQKEEPITKQDG